MSRRTPTMTKETREAYERTQEAVDWICRSNGWKISGALRKKREDGTYTWFWQVYDPTPNAIDVGKELDGDECVRIYEGSRDEPSDTGEDASPSD